MKNPNYLDLLSTEMDRSVVQAMSNQFGEIDDHGNIHTPNGLRITYYASNDEDPRDDYVNRSIHATYLRPTDDGFEDVYASVSFNDLPARPTEVHEIIRAEDGESQYPVLDRQQKQRVAKELIELIQANYEVAAPTS